MSNIQDLNDLANEIVVARLEEQDSQKMLDDYLAKDEIYQKIIFHVEEFKRIKNEFQDLLMNKMRENELKSWKTEKASFARAVRKSVVLNPMIKSQIEKKVKGGEQVDGWELKETEYISIRLSN